jgi:hypothetical protein
MSAPRGINEIKARYGNPNSNGKVSQTWVQEYLMQVDLPYPMRVAGHESQVVTHIQFNKNAADALKLALTNVYNYVRGMMKTKYGFNHTTAFYDQKTMEYLKANNLDLYGGAFVFRLKRGSKTSLSMHSYAIAIDINPQNNPMGGKTVMPAWFVKCFESIGFTWGGRWNGKYKDGMHMQLGME